MGVSVGSGENARRKPLFAQSDEFATPYDDARYSIGNCYDGVPSQPGACAHATATKAVVRRSVMDFAGKTPLDMRSCGVTPIGM